MPKFSFIPVSNPSFYELQPTIQEHEELVWLAGNLKLEVTNYSRSYMAWEEWPIQVVVVVVMMMMMMMVIVVRRRIWRRLLVTN